MQDQSNTGVPVTTEQLFAIIGELTVQVKVLQGMLSAQLEVKDNGAIKERQIQSSQN